MERKWKDFDLDARGERRPSNMQEDAPGAVAGVDGAAAGAGGAARCEQSDVLAVRLLHEGGLWGASQPSCRSECPTRC